MEGLVKHGYTGINPRSKVRYLLDGIKTDKFDSVKTWIMSEATLWNDFDACVTLYHDFIKQTSKSKTPPTVGILVVRTRASGTKSTSKNIEERQYTKLEEDALSADAKRELAAKRLKRGHNKPGATDSRAIKDPKTRDTKTKDSNTKVTKNLKAVKRSVAQHTK
jgi:hypothetical protein